MKALVKRAALTVSLLIACWRAQGTTNIAEVVLSEASFQRPLVFVKRELPDALSSAELVVRARVLDTHSTVKASPKQQEVSADQGWRAALVQAPSMLRGDQQLGPLWVINMGFHGNGTQWHFPIEATNGQPCILILEKDKKHSRWCQTNVFAVVKGFEVK